MENNFVPECFFDTVLVRTILKTKHINHKKGCANVVKEIESGKLKDDFAVGIIDKDKKELKYIRDHCREEIKRENLILLKHREKQHYFVQLVPAIEKWILNTAEEANIDIESKGFPTDVYKLRIRTKSELASENQKLKELCTELTKSKSETIATLTRWLVYLYEHNRNADINTLKENV